MEDVAERAGVGLSSVSRVINDHPSVSPRMRQAVLSAIRDLDYSPDILAQSVRQRRSASVGFVIPDISNPLFAEIALGAETTLRDAGYATLLTNSESDPDLDAANITLFDRRRVDALLVSTADENHEATIAALAAIEVPITFLDREIPKQLTGSAVLSDHLSGTRAAVEHLLELGHRRVGFVAGGLIRATAERVRGLEEAYANRGLPPDYVIERPTGTRQSGFFSVEHAETSTERLLSLDDPVTALVAGGNQLLLGVVRVLRRRQLAVGRDISLVTCDEVPVAELQDPPIATIARDTRRIGVAAARLLLASLEGGPPEQITLPTTFVATASTARLADR